MFSGVGTIESNNVASTAIVEFLIVRHRTMMAFVVLAHTEQKAGQLRSRVHDAGNATEQFFCNGLAVISSLRIISVGHCRNCCHIVIMSQLYPSEVVTSHFLHCYCSTMYSFVAIDGFICNKSSDMETKLLQMFFLLCMEVKG